MHLQLLVVIALATLSAAYLGYRMFGSLLTGRKTPAGCSDCSAVSSCTTIKGAHAKDGAPGGDCPADRPFVS